MKHKTLIFVLLSLLFTCEALPQSVVNSSFKIARLTFNGGGDWYNDPLEETNLLKYVRDHTNIDVDPKYEFVEITNILRCEAESNYTMLYVKGGEKHLASKTLKEFENMLMEFQFIRVHQSHLVNANQIKQYIKGDGGMIILNDGSEVAVSRKYKEGLLKKMMHL